MNLRTARVASVSLALAGAAIGVLPGLAPAQDEGPGTDSLSLANDASRRAAKKALDWLVANQEDNGSWRCNVGFKLNDQYQVEKINEPHVGVTALAGTAFLASGSVPGRGPYAENVQRALEFVMSCQKPDSGFITHLGTRMYEHAFATLFLAEVYGMTHDPAVRRSLQQAVEFTYKSQNSQGGWRYAPNAEDSDMSIVVCQVMALRAAKNKGITVPKESIDKAVDYVLNSANTTSQGGWMQGYEQGTFLYQYDPKNQAAAAQGRTSFALTAAGLTTLYGAGVYEDADIARIVAERKLPKYQRGREPLPQFKHMIQYVLSHYDDVASVRNSYFYFYGNYYAAQALFIRGGRDWVDYYTRLRDDLVAMQRTDGGTSSNVGTAFSTAVTALLLAVPNNYLPIFQR